MQGHVKDGEIDLKSFIVSQVVQLVDITEHVKQAK